MRAFPSGNAKPSSLAEQLKSALAGETGIRINEIRFVAEDGSVAGLKVAAQLTAKALGASSDKMRDIFEDPNKLLQLILAAESNRGGGGGGGNGPGLAAGPGGGLAVPAVVGSSWSGGTGGGGSCGKPGKHPVAAELAEEPAPAQVRERGQAPEREEAALAEDQVAVVAAQAAAPAEAERALELAQELEEDLVLPVAANPASG